MDLMRSDAPTLALLDYLDGRGWEGQSTLATHNASSSLIYDNRKPVTKKRYFQCLIICDSLFAAGITEITSGRPQTYYAYILKYRKLPAPGRSMQDLLKEINGAAGDEDFVPLPFVSTVAPAPVAIDDEIAADIGDTIMEIPPSPLAAEPEPTPDPIRNDDPELEPSQNAIEDDEIAGSPDESRPPHAVVPHADEWPLEIEGVALVRISGRRGGSHSQSARLGATCPCCCLRSRSVALLSDTLGRNAALCYLGVWLEKFGSLAPADHRRFVPSLEEMQSYRARKLAD